MLVKPAPPPMIRALSFGGGVQSTVLALMSMHGELEPLDWAVMGDTEAEPTAVYEHIRWMKSANLGLPFPIEIVSAGSLKDETLASAQSWQALGQTPDRSIWRTASRIANPPFFTRGPKIHPATVTLPAMPLFGIEEETVPFLPEKEVGDEVFGFLGRKCTGDYKIDPIIKLTRQKLGIEPGKRGPKDVVVEQWIGISTDEAARMKPSGLSYIRHRFPLIELGMSRGDCLEWLRKKGYPRPPKSRCYFCPFQSDELWLDMQTTDPESFTAACDFDDAIRNGIRGTLHKLFLHRNRVPLREIDFSHAMPGALISGFINECEGVCGV